MSKNISDVERVDKKIIIARTPTPLLPPLEDSDVEKLWNTFSNNNNIQTWVQEFTPYHINNMFHIALVDKLSPVMLFKFDLLTIFYIYFSIFCYFPTVVDVVQSDSLRGFTVASIFKEYPKYTMDIAGLGSFSKLFEILYSETYALVGLDNDRVAYCFMCFRNEITTYFIPDRKLDISTNQFKLLVMDMISYLNMPKLTEESLQIYWRFLTIFKFFSDDRVLVDALTKDNTENGIFYYPVLLYYKYLNIAQKNKLIEDVIFFVLRDRLANLSITEARRLYSSSLTGYLHKAVAATILLQKVGESLSETAYQEGLAREIQEHVRIIQEIIIAGNQHPPMRYYTPHNLAGLFLLQLVPQEQLFKAVLPDKSAFFGLGDYRLKLCPANYALFPFMVDEQYKDLGKAFAETINMLQTTEEAAMAQITRDICNAGPTREIIIRHRYRMFILLVCYYHYYNRLQSCNIMLRLLNNQQFLEALDIRPKEKTVYERLASEPMKSERSNSLQYLFSYQIRENKEDYSLANIMVNAMAIALGSHRSSNHLYTYAFDISNSGACSPGSIAEGKVKLDSGYPISDSSYLQNLDNPAKLALNILVWVGIAWSYIIDSKISARTGFLSEFIATLGFLERFSPDTKIQEHIIEKLQRFFSKLCSACEAQHGNGLHYLTESLWRMWEEINQPDNNNWIGAYRTERDAKIYEETLLTIFSKILVEYKHLHFRNQVAHSSNRHIRNIINVQTHQQQRFTSPILPFSVFIDYLKNYCIAKGVYETQDDDYPCCKYGTLCYNTNPKHQQEFQHPVISPKLKRVSSNYTINFTAIGNSRYQPSSRYLLDFVQQRHMLHVLKHIPTLVKFYRYLHGDLAKRVSREDCNTLKFPECLRGKLNEVQDIQQWEKFQRAWSEIAQNFQEASLDVRDIPLLELVGQSKENRGLVFSLIHLLVSYQVQVIKKATVIKQDYVASKLPLFEIDKYLELDLIVLGSYSVEEFESVIMSQVQLDGEFNISSLQFDIDRITELVWDKALFGKVELLDVEFFLEFNPQKKQPIDNIVLRKREPSLGDLINKYTVRYSQFPRALPDSIYKFSMADKVEKLITDIRDRKIKSIPFYLVSKGVYLNPNAILANHTLIDCFPGILYNVSFEFPNYPPRIEPFPSTHFTSTLFEKARDLFSLPLDQISLSWDETKIKRSNIDTIDSLFASNMSPQLSVRLEIPVKVLGKPQSALKQPKTLLVDGYEARAESTSSDTCVLWMAPLTPLHLFWGFTDHLFPKMVAIGPNGWTQRPKLGKKIPISPQTVDGLQQENDSIIVKLFPEDQLQFISISVNSAAVHYFYTLPNTLVTEIMEQVLGTDNIRKYHFNFPELAPEVRAVEDKLRLPLSSFAKGLTEIQFFASLPECFVMVGEKEYKIPFEGDEMTLNVLKLLLEEELIDFTDKSVCTDTGIMLAEPNSRIHPQQKLILVPNSELISIEVKGAQQCTVKVHRTTKLPALADYLSLPLVDHLFFCESVRISTTKPLWSIFGANQRMEILVKKQAQCRTIKKTMIWNDNEVFIEVLHNTKLETIEKFAKFTFDIQNVEIQDSDGAIVVDLINLEGDVFYIRECDFV